MGTPTCFGRSWALARGGHPAQVQTFYSSFMEKWALVLICGFCNVLLISPFIIVLKFEVDGKLNC